MKHYVLYAPTGVIRQTLTISDDSPEPSVPGLTTIEVPAAVDGLSWHVANGQLAPGLLDLRTLQDHKAERWEAIKQDRSAAEYGGFTWDSSPFDSDAISQARITGSVVMAILAAEAAQPFSQDWTLADNGVRTLDGPSMKAVGAALGTHVGTAHEVARVLRGQIEAATTIEEVEAVVWPT